MFRRRLAPVLAVAVSLLGAVVPRAAADTDEGTWSVNCVGDGLDPFEMEMGLSLSDVYDPMVGGDDTEYRLAVTAPRLEKPDAVPDLWSAFLTEIRAVQPVPPELSASAAHYEGVGDYVTADAVVNGYEVDLRLAGELEMDGSIYAVPDLVIEVATPTVAADTTIEWLPMSSLEFDFVVVTDLGIEYTTGTYECTFDGDSIGSTTLTPNHDPVPHDDAMVVDPGITEAITLAAHDDDQPSQVLSLTGIETPPTHGTAVLEPPDVVHYTSDAAYTGDDSFTFRVEDDHGGAAIGTIEVFVTDVDYTPPTVIIDSPVHGGVYDEDGTPPVVEFSCWDTGVNSEQSTLGSELLGSQGQCLGTDEDGDPVPDGSNLDLSTAGPHSLTVRAIDNSGNPATRTVSYNVVNRAAVEQYDGAVPVDCLWPWDSVPVTVNAPDTIELDGTYTVEVRFRNDKVTAFAAAFGFEYTFGISGGHIVEMEIDEGTGTANIQGDDEAELAGGFATYRIDEFLVGPQTFRGNKVRLTVEADGAPPGDEVSVYLSDFAVRFWPAFPGIPFLLHCGGDGTTLASTDVLDVTPPELTVATPEHAVVYDAGSSLIAGYECSDYYLVACTGTVADGAALPTDEAGIDEFTVYATDSYGNRTRLDNTYYISDPEVSVGEIWVDEGEGPGVEATFSVALSHPSRRSVTVGYSTQPGTAGEDDYTPVSGTLVFPAGETEQTVEVEIADDLLDEPDAEYFYLELADPTYARLGEHSVAAGFVVDDDEPPAIGGSSVTVTEGDGTLDVDLEFGLVDADGDPAPSGREVTADWVTAEWTIDERVARPEDGDYIDASGSIAIEPGDTSATVTVTVTGDTAVEGDEYFMVCLSDVVNATPVAFPYYEGLLDGCSVVLVRDDD